MTTAEACTTLGVSQPVRRTAVQQAFQVNHKKLQSKVVPGNCLADRQKAQAELVKLTTARQVLLAQPANKPAGRKPSSKKPQRHKQVPTTTYPQPQDLAEAWEQLVQLLPFSKSVATTVIILIFVLSAISLISKL